MRRIAMAALFLALAASLAACGGPAAPPPKAEGAAAAPAPKKKGAEAAAVVDPAAKALENPDWPVLAEHFVRFTKKPVSSQKDVFKSHLDKYVEKVEFSDLMRKKEEGGDDVAIPKKEDDLDPLKKFPADEYKLVVVLTGTASPRALVQDPKGNAYEVGLDQEIGNEHGVIEAITQYEVVIRQENEPKPVRLNVRPEVFDVESLQAKARAMAEEAESLPVPEDAPSLDEIPPPLPPDEDDESQE